VRVVLYRDHAAWCPYCQKVWLQLEEKRVPYRVEKINMRSYGDKPDWFLQKVPGGLLPAVEIDGKLLTESLVIMQVIESTFASFGPPMLPSDDAGVGRANELLQLERQLFGAWCGLVFRPSMPGPLGAGPKKAFEACLDKVEEALGESPGPWLLDGEHPTVVDLQYVSHVERMNASVLYWKGINMRGGARWPRLERWLDAFEQRPAYQASKSDYYTHVMDIPPQYGPGFEDGSREASEARELISGKSWRLPLALGPAGLEPLTPHMDKGEEAARHEAAYRLAGNAAAITRFAARGAGRPGRKQFGAPLADPYATPDDAIQPAVDELLRGVACALLTGDASEAAAPAAGVKNKAAARECLAYLRDRVGVPRDMPLAPAMHLRAYLNAAIDAL